MIRYSYLLVLAVFLTACHPPMPDDPTYAPVMPEPKENFHRPVGGLYHPKIALSLYSDIKARHVGDIITVVLSEQTDASVKLESDLSRDSSASIENPTVLGAKPSFNTPNLLPLDNNKDNTLEVQASGNSSFSGDGESKQNNKLTGTIAVTVTQVLPNGNLVVRGEKWINLNQGKEFIRLSGMLRPEDVNPDNTVSSAKIANARIHYGGVGAIANANRPGWLIRGIHSIVWPF